MDKEYTVIKAESKTWQGKNYLVVELEGVGEATIWELDKNGARFPLFETITFGSKVRGNLWTKPGTSKKTLYAPKPQQEGQTPRYGASRAPSGALEAAKVTAKSVEKAIERKEDSFKVSATHRDAVLFAVAEYQEGRRLSSTFGLTLEQLYEKWRAYFWNHYDVSDADFNPPFEQ